MDEETTEAPLDEETTEAPMDEETTTAPAYGTLSLSFTLFIIDQFTFFHYQVSKFETIA